MILLKQGNKRDAYALAGLVLSSAPVLLPYLFGSREKALCFIEQAGGREDGQYSATRHQLAFDGDKVVASLTLWSSDLPASFHQHTIQSLSDYLSAEQVAHLLSSNEHIASVFLPPTSSQLCLGHLAVLEDYQGIGIGKKMIAYALQQAKIQNKKQVILDVDAENEQALHFYLGMGFIVQATTSFSPTSQEFIRMYYTV